MYVSECGNSGSSKELVAHVSWKWRVSLFSTDGEGKRLIELPVVTYSVEWDVGGRSGTDSRSGMAAGLVMMEPAWPLEQPAAEADWVCSANIFIRTVAAVWRWDGALGGELAVIGDLRSIAT